jgi:hypothetical protein
MNNRALLSFVVVGLTAVGCVGPLRYVGGELVEAEARKAGALTCSVSTCDISLTCNGALAVASPDWYIPPGATPTMKWTVKDGYSFDNNGLTFKTADGNSEFDGANPQPGTTVYTRYDRHTKPGTYAYEIFLKGPKGACSVDPFVFNG